MARKKAEAAEPGLADFDLDQWIDGVGAVTRQARIVQRGDLFAEVDRLEHALDVAERLSEADRGVGDPGVEDLQAQLDAVWQQIWQSTLVVHLQDRTVERRRQLRDRLKKRGVSDEDIALHLVADAIVRVETTDGREVPLPEGGFPAAKLRQIRERAGDAALYELEKVYADLVTQSPRVAPPLSRKRS